MKYSSSNFINKNHAIIIMNHTDIIEETQLKKECDRKYIR